MGASGTSVALAFGVQITLALVVFLVFSRLRLSGFARRFYAPKRFDTTIENKPRRLPPGLFGWMSVVYTYPEADVVKVAGLDAAIYLRVLKFGWEVFLKVTLVTCIIILPIQLSGDQVNTLLTKQAEEEAAAAAQNTASPMPTPSRLLMHAAARALLQGPEIPVQLQSPVPSPPAPPMPLCMPPPSTIEVKKYSFTAFDKCSIANLPPGSPKLWAHIIVIYVITYIVLTTLTRYSKQATLLRLAFLANVPRGGPSHTVLVTDIPGMRYGTVAWYLRGFAGSTLFLLLPASWKKKVLDTVESGLVMVGSMANADIASRMQRRPTSDGGAPPAALIPTAMAKAAEANTKEAEDAEAHKEEAATGVIRRRRRKPGTEIAAADESLDPWFQAEEVLGDMNNPRADLVAAFIEGEMEGTYGRNCVAAVNPVWDQRELNPLLAEYQKVRQALEDYLDTCANRLKRRKPIKKRLRVTVVGPTMGQWGIERYGVKAQKVDAIDHWTARLAYLAKAIPEAQERCEGKAIPAAFVTVNQRATQVTMSTTLHHHDETTWQIQGAPEPKEVIWGSLPMRRWERSLRTLGMWVVYVVLLCFYMIPITAIQGLINVPKLATVPVLKDIVNLPVVKQVIEGIIPGLVLVIFLALLPSILALFCRISGFVSTSQVDFGVVTRYFYFQVVALFLGSLVAGSLFNQLKEFFNNPQSLINILGSAIPGTAAFFINYILVAGIGKTGIKHLRVVPLIIYWLKSKVAATPRARARLWSDQYNLYGPSVPDFTVYFLLGAVYCCVNPIISPTVLIFYSFAIISERYNQLYVFKCEYESGGRLWYYVFNQFMVGLYFFQIFMIVLLSLKQFYWVVLLIPCPIITFAYHIATLTLNKRPWTVMSAHDAAMLDRMDQEDNGLDEVTPQEKRLIQEMYLSPVFKFRPEEVRGLLREADIVSRQINGEKLADIEADLDEKAYQSAEEEEEVEEEDSESVAAATKGHVQLELSGTGVASAGLMSPPPPGSSDGSVVDTADVKPRF